MSKPKFKPGDPVRHKIYREPLTIERPVMKKLKNGLYDKQLYYEFLGTHIRYPERSLEKR